MSGFLQYWIRGMALFRVAISIIGDKGGFNWGFLEEGVFGGAGGFLGGRVCRSSRRSCIIFLRVRVSSAWRMTRFWYLTLKVKAGTAWYPFC